MNSFPELNFPKFCFRVRAGADGSPEQIWDEMRGCWLALTPEEWVRRHLLRFFTQTMEVTPQLISQECPVRIGGMHQRADAVVHGCDGRPLLLAECKAPHIALDAAVYAQAVRYNTVIGARYLFITNGMKHFIYENTGDGNYIKLEKFPDLSPSIKNLPSL